MNFVFDIFLIYFQKTDYNLIDPREYIRNINSISFYFLDRDNIFLR
jgi:hypothetical protein